SSRRAPFAPLPDVQRRRLPRCRGAGPARRRDRPLVGLSAQQRRGRWDVGRGPAGEPTGAGARRPTPAGRPRPAERRSEPAFEAEWARMGGVLRADLGAPSAAAFDGVRPAAARALGEAALPQVRAYYQASLDYGKSTEPASGLYYLGLAQAERELAAFCRTLSAPSSLPPPPVRDLHAELDALEGELLAAYRPPASIARHGEFIGASSTLKEARELDAAGLRYGALLRYLQAAQRVAALRPPSPTPLDLAAGALARRLRELDARLAASGVDDSLGRLFLETAEAEAAASPSAAAEIAGDVLPRYFAALAPARPEPPKPAPRVTVTLVRWPYT